MSDERTGRINAFFQATSEANDDLKAAGVDPNSEFDDDPEAWLTAKHGQLAAQESALFGAPLVGDDDLRDVLEAAQEQYESVDAVDAVRPVIDLLGDRQNAVQTTLEEPTEGRRKAHELARRVDGLGNDPPRYIADGGGDDRPSGVFDGESRELDDDRPAGTVTDSGHTGPPRGVFGASEDDGRDSDR